MALTKDDLKALRNADDSVSFYWLPGNASATGRRPGTSRSILVARKRHDPGDGFGPRTLDVEIVMEPPRFTIYDRSGGTNGAEPGQCYASVHSPRFTPSGRP